MRELALALIVFMSIQLGYAQTLEELKTEKNLKADSIAAIQERVDAIQKRIKAMPGWKTGAFGTVGTTLSGFNNWYSKGAPNSSAGNIGVTVNAFANLKQDKFFWRNALKINLGWVKFDDKDIDTDDDSFRSSTDVFTLSSLYGRKLGEKFAISGLVEYRSTIIDNFNDPGYLDLGLGATWTPITDLVVVIHPLNYNLVFSGEDTVFESSFGAKIVADYTRQLGKINFKTNLSMFQSYESSDLSNRTWTNSFGYTLWRGIGLGFEFGLRDNKQEALSYAISNMGVTDPEPTFENVNNDLQTYWLFGLNYSF